MTVQQTVGSHSGARQIGCRVDGDSDGCYQMVQSTIHMAYQE